MIPSEIVDGVFGELCHQFRSRCFEWMPWLCARCLGLYLGALAGAIAILAVRTPHRKSLPWILAVAIAVTPAEVGIEKLGWWKGTMPVRMILGIVTGIGLAVWLGTVRGLKGTERPWFWAVPVAIAALFFVQAGPWLRYPALLGCVSLVGVACYNLGTLVFSRSR